MLFSSFVQSVLSYGGELFVRLDLMNLMLDVVFTDVELS